MSEIPADIMAAAKSVVETIELNCNVYYPDAVTEALALAILFERERCAAICDYWAQNCGPYSDIPADIAKEIRGSN